MYTLKSTQFLPIDIRTAWTFFSSPKNLKRITPPSMGFDILSNTKDDRMYNGQIVKYKVKPMFNLPLVWVSELKYINAPYFFVDEQKQGPYKVWHHQHFLFEVEGGVLVEDEVNYQLPMGILGRFAHWLFVRRQLQTIFDYRKKKLQEIFVKNSLKVTKAFKNLSTI